MAYESLDIVKSKPVTGVNDLLLVLIHHWAKDTAIFPNEEQRVQLLTILLFAAFTAPRPAELDNPDDFDYEEDSVNEETKRSKSLCWEDIELSLVPKPGRRPGVSMRVRMANHKGADRKPKPTIFFSKEEDDPILDPVTHLATLALRRNTFKALSSKSMEHNYSLEVQEPLNSIMRWKPEMLKKPVFCLAVGTVDGFRTSYNKPLRYSTFHYYIQRLGLKTGFEEDLSAYCIRRGSGNAIDGAASKAIRESGVSVKFDVQAAFLERPSADGLVKALSHMSLTCDPRASMSAPNDCMDTLPPDPAIVKLQQERKNTEGQDRGRVW
ncbi:MAG: hypothetical protein M1830_003251 [Pleopsidium flavum]|nr:MAG: hypothetical protein M1830_003251 [Pleopsidium flavum]